MGRMLTASVALTAALSLLLAGCGSSPRPMPTTQERSSAASSTRPTTTATTTKLPLADVDFSDEADVKFLAALRTKGVPIADEDAETDMVLAGQGVCMMMLNEGEDLINTSAWVMDTYEVSGDQAGDIAVTAIDIYCPTASSLR